MKNRHFFKGLSWLILLNVLIKPIWIFGIDRQVQNSIGHQTYGNYFALISLSFVLLFIADAGLSNMLTQRIAAKEMIGTMQLLHVKFFFLFFYVVAACFVAWLTHVSEWNLLFYIIIIQVLNSFFVFLRGLLTANQFFTTDALFSVLDKGLLIFLCGGFIYGVIKPISIILFVQLQAASAAVAVITLLVIVFKKKLFIQASKQTLGKLLKWTAPFAVIILLMSVHYKLDAFLLERLHPAGALQAGIYASAFRLVDAANMVGYLSASFLVAFIARHKADGKAMQQVVLITRHALLFFAIAISCFTSQFAPWIQQLLYHTTDDYTSLVLQLCLLALPAYCLVHVYGAALTATANFRLFTVVLCGAVLINILLNLWLIPAYGAAGCCIAMLVSQYSCGIALCIAATRKLQLSYSLTSILFYFLSAVIFFLLFYYSTRVVNIVWIILAAIALLIAFAVIMQRQFIRKIFFLFSK